MMDEKKMYDENFAAMYRVDFTGDGRRYSDPDILTKIRGIREYYGFLTFSCKIAISNAGGKTQDAIRILLKAFGPRCNVSHDTHGPLRETR